MYTFLNLHNTHKLIEFQAKKILNRFFVSYSALHPIHGHSMKVLTMLYVTMDRAVIAADINTCLEKDGKPAYVQAIFD